MPKPIGGHVPAMASLAETATTPRVRMDNASPFTSDSPCNYRRYGGATVGITLASAGGKDAPSGSRPSLFGDDSVDEPQGVYRHGTFTLKSYDSIDFYSEFSDECWGTGGYDDIQPSAQVKVSDSAERVLAIGELESLTYEFSECVFTFEVPDVPTGEKLYQIEVSHRGTITYSEDEMREYLSLTLGD